jgi:hypothetical protein
MWLSILHGLRGARYDLIRTDDGNDRKEWGGDQGFAGETDKTWIFWRLLIAKNNAGDEFEREKVE